MKKRPIVQKKDENSAVEEETAAQVCTSACLSLWDSFLMLDHTYTTHLALCATKESSLGYLRPVMKLLEISCHGVSWIVGTLILFLCSHKSQDIEISVNLLLALLFDLVIVGLLKMTFRRSRPSHNVMDMFAAPSVDKFSFPSGHATRAAMMGLFLGHHVFSHQQLAHQTHHELNVNIFLFPSLGERKNSALFIHSSLSGHSASVPLLSGNKNCVCQVLACTGTHATALAVYKICMTTLIVARQCSGNDAVDIINSGPGGMFIMSQRIRGLDFYLQLAEKSVDCL